MVDNDTNNPHLDGLQGVRSQEFIDGEVLHERVVVIHLVLCLLQAWEEVNSYHDWGEG